MKVNQAGVVPVIFASSLLYFPQLAVSMLGHASQPQGWVAWTDRYLTPSVTVFGLYYLAFFLLIMVGVRLDTVKQIESQLQRHNYASFLR